jgi:hypothetical protein
MNDNSEYSKEKYNKILTEVWVIQEAPWDAYRRKFFPSP